MSSFLDLRNYSFFTFDLVSLMKSFTFKIDLCKIAINIRFALEFSFLIVVDSFAYKH